MTRPTLMVLVLMLSVPAARALHDPTRPTDPAEYFGSTVIRDGSPWTLQSILSSSERRVAVINGTRVKEGDSIGSARVLSIQPGQVVLRTADGRRTLRLWDTNRIKVNP